MESATSNDMRQPDRTLSVDCFALSVGGTSVGLPWTCTSDDVLRRYLDLVRLMQARPGPQIIPRSEDLRTLAEASAVAPEVLARRIAALQG